MMSKKVNDLLERAEALGDKGLQPLIDALVALDNPTANSSEYKALEDAIGGNDADKEGTKVSNVYSNVIALPNGQTIQPGDSVTVQDWVLIESHDVIKAWIDAGVLEVS